jgi:hypothetical protein
LAIDLAFRRRATRSITTQIGCYVLCDLDQVPLYVGQSRDSIRARVNRHLTSARSDIIANRQVDVWEIAWVWTYPVDTKDEIAPLEEALFLHFNAINPLINRKKLIGLPMAVLPEPSAQVQVMSPAEIAEKSDPALRLPRQAEHYSQIVSHFLAVKNSPQIAVGMQAHFARLAKYHDKLLGLTEVIPGDRDDDSSAD